MKSQLTDMMHEKGVTVAELQERIQYTKVIKKGPNKGIEKDVRISTATIMEARDNEKILNCRLFTLSLIANALGCQVKDLFLEDEEPKKEGTGATNSGKR